MVEQAPLRAHPALAAGTLVAGKYRVERSIGEGGMGTVYVAHHEQLDVRVALKLVRADLAADPTIVQRFLREARAAARLKSPHVAQVQDVGTVEDGRPFMILELLRGTDLEKVIAARGPLPATEAVDLALEALAGLAAIHAADFVHRDIKPANLFLDSSGAKATLKVLDLGLAKALQGRELDRGVLTTTSTAMGTPAYMAPEQLRSSKDVDARADLWSLGVVLYEMLTGALPFEGATVGAFLAAVMEGAPRPPRHLRPDLPEPLEAVVLRCLRRDRAQRFASAIELARALLPFGSPAAAEIVREIQRHSDDDTAEHESDRWLAKTQPALPPTFETAPVARTKSRTRRKSSKAVIIGLAVLVVAFAFGVGFVVSQLGR